jgi:histidyl-tRNA synthetase
MSERTKYQTIKGTNDRLPDVSWRWQQILATASRVLEACGAGEIHTPIFEDTGVFTKAVGESSDIVQKEMFKVLDRGNRDLTLRPEATAPIMRAFLQHGYSSKPLPAKFWTFEPMFRGENVAKGRERQFHQIGLEIIGSEATLADAEVIERGYSLLTTLGIKDITVYLGSVGTPSDRAEYNVYLRGLLAPVHERLSPDSQGRLLQNPMRILDSKDAGDQALLAELAVKPILELMSAPSQAYFAEIQGYLSAWEIPFVIDQRLVRGLDYYWHTVFEIKHNNIGANSTIVAGGRYDGLSEMLGGPAMPGVGFGAGIERIELALEAEKITLPARPQPLAHLLPLDQAALMLVAKLSRQLRQQLWPQNAVVLANLKVKAAGKALQDANKSGAKFAVLIGSGELASGLATVKNLASGEQSAVAFAALAEFLVD